MKNLYSNLWKLWSRKNNEIEIIRPMCWMAMVLVMILGILLGGKSYEEIDNLPENQEFMVEGRIVNKQYKESYYGGYWQIVLKNVKILSNEAKTEGGVKGEGQTKEVLSLKGKYICQITEEDASFKIGQWILVKGKFLSWEEATNPGQFDMKKWYCSQGILGQWKKALPIKKSDTYSVIGETLWQVRSYIHEKLRLELGEKDGALISAMLLGEKSDLEEETKSLYRRNGISHILAISGLHLMVLGMGLFSVLKHIFGNNKVVAVICSSLMFIYCVFTGSSVSTVRATMMFMISFSAKILGRSYDSLSALGLAAIVQLLVNPYGLNNSGFMLSFLAVIGVTFIAPKLQELLGIKRKLIKAFCVSMSATITTLPVVLRNYGTYPWYSVLLNLCILPVMSVLLFLAIFLIFLFWIPDILRYVEWIQSSVNMFENTKKIVVFIIKSILRYLEFSCEIFENLHFTDGCLGSPSGWKIVFYIGLTGLVFSRFWSHSLFCKKMILVSSFAFLTLQTSFGTEIVMLDVGQGDGYVLRNDKGNIYISDCGSSSVNQVGKYRLLPFLKYKGYGKIKGIFISHLDTDHVSGIVELLELAKEEKIEIENLFLPETILSVEKDKEKLDEILQLASKNEMKVSYLGQGDKITDGNMQILCLHPGENYEKEITEEDRNNQSLVLLVAMGNLKLLLSGDVEKEGEKEILEWVSSNGIDMESGILKVAHHGSSGSGSEKFLEAVRPKLSLISCGENNRYGHPHKETLEKLEAIGSKVVSTAKSGAITIKGGRKIKVYRYKKDDSWGEK